MLGFGVAGKIGQTIQVVYINLYQCHHVLCLLGHALDTVELNAELSDASFLPIRWQSEELRSKHQMQ